MAQGERASLGCTGLLVPMLLCLAAAGAWSQQVNAGELDTTAGRSFQFQNYAGPQPVVQSIDQIVGIGEVLSRHLRAGGSRGDYFGKYTVIRAFQPSETTRLSADIIIPGARAQIDDIRNVHRIVAGYLAAAFGYDSSQASRLAVLVTKYNAAYRGNLAALSQRYTPLVMSYLTAENAGIALSYAEWPGKTRLIVPLGHAAGAQEGGAPTGPAGPASPAAGAPSSAGAGPGAAGGTTPGASPPGQQVATPGATARAGATAGSSATPGGALASPGGASATSAVQGASPRSPGFVGINWYWWPLALAALLLLALLVFLFVRLIGRVLRPSYDSELRRSVQEGHSLVEMVVIPQNRRIGHRNIHYLKPGASASVGSGRARFLVYFVPVPRRMALLKYDGRGYSFVPLKSDLFPGLSGPVSDCLGKGIPARSLRGYRFTIIFNKFHPPLEEINRLMRSARPGAPAPGRLPPP